MERSISNQRPFRHPIRLRNLPPGQAWVFDLTLDADARASVALAVGVPLLRKLRFSGRMIPEGRADWRLKAVLGATIEQACVVTLAPVVTRIDVTVVRRYLANPPALPEGEEIRAPEDDSIEPLPETVDLGTVLTEALALAVPEYPHAPQVEPFDGTFTDPASTPTPGETVRPFADLAGLRARILGEEDQ